MLDASGERIRSGKPALIPLDPEPTNYKDDDEEEHDRGGESPLS